MGFPKKISQLPLNLSLKPEDLLVTVNDNDITSKIELNQLISFVTGGTNSFVSGGTYNDVTKNIDFVGTSTFPPFSVNLSGISTSDTFITGATLNGFILEIDRNNGEPQITVDLSPLTGDTDTNTFVTGTTLVGTNYTLERNDGTSFTTDFNPIISGKVDTTLFDSYTADTQTEINSKLDITTFDTYTANTTDDVVTGATLVGTTLELERNNGLSDVTVDLSSLTGSVDTNTFITGTTLVGDSYTLKRNDGVDITTDFNPIISGKVNTSLFDSYTANTETEINSKLDITTFDTYTANTTDNVVTGATLVGGTLELERNNGLSDVTVDLSSLSGDTNTFVTGATLTNTTLGIERNDGVDITVDLSSIDDNVFVNSGNANAGTQQLIFTNTSGGTFNVTNAAALFSDNDVNVTGGTYNPTNGCVTFGTNSGTTFDVCGFVTGFTDVYVTGSTLVGTNYTLTRTDNTTISTDFNPIVSGKVNTSLFDSYTANTETEINTKLDESIFNTYTANTTDDVVTGATLVGATLELERNNGLSDVTVDLSPLSGISENTFVSGTTLVGTNYTLERNDGVDITTDFNSIVSGKVDTTIFDTYTANTTDNVVTGATLVGATLELERNNGLSDVTVDLSSLTGSVDTNTFVTGSTLVGTTLELERNDGVDITVDLSSLTGSVDTNTFITGTTLSGNDLTIGRNDGVEFTTDLTPIISGKVDTTLFDTYTANTTDNVVTGATLVGTILELGRNNGLSDVTVNLSSLTGAVDTNTFVTAATLTNTTLDITRNDGVNIPVNLGSLTFTGNTSGTCINELWVSNISGCSPVTIGTELIVNGFMSGKTTTLFGENTAGGASRTGLNPTLTIFDDGGSGGGAQTYSGPTLRLSDNGNTSDIFYRYNGGGNVLSNALNFISDGGFNFIAEGDNGSPGLSDGPYFRVTKGQSSLSIYDDTTRPRTDVKITNVNGGSAYSRLGVGAQSDYWYIEADDVDTPMHIGYDDNGVDTNVFTFEKSEGLLEGSLEITSGLTADTITISDTPTLNNAGTEVLVRNSTTGEVEYRSSSTFSGSSSGEINTGNVLWVDSIFGDDATAVTNRQDLSYLTVEQALSDATNGDTVIVRPGEYDEEELLVNQGVSLISEGGWEVTILGKSSGTAIRNIVELNENSFIDGFSINVPAGNLSGILSSNVSGTSTANNITFYGNSTTGSSGTGLYKTGGGKLIGFSIRVEGGGMNNCLKVDSGTLALEGVHVPQSNGSIDNVLLVTTSGGTNAGRAQMVGFNCGNTNITNGIRTEGGSAGVIPVAKIFTPNISNSTNALSASGDYENINLLGGSLENVTYSVKIDLTGTGVDASYRITSNHQPNYIYPPAVAYTAEFGLDFTQESTDEFNSSKNLFGLSQMSLGFAEKGTELNAGRGAPSTVGMKVFTTDNTASSVSDGGNITDVTDDAKSKIGSTITFQTGGTNTTILFTTQRVSSDLTTPLKYYGIDLNILQKKVGGDYVFEYWNGSEWIEDLVHIHSADLGYSYGNELFLRNQSDENLLFDLSKDTWSAKTISGVNGYWMRCRMTSTGTTQPTIEQSKIIYDSSTISKDGVLSFNGKSLYKEVTNLYNGTWGYPVSSLSDYNVTVGSGAGLQTWTHEFLDSQFATGEAATFVLKIPQGTSTSQKVNVNATYTLNGTNADDTPVDLAFSFLPVKVANIKIADKDGDKEPVARVISATTAFNTYEAQTTTVSSDFGEDKMFQVPLGSFDISDYYEGDIVLMRLEKDAGTSVNFNLISLDFEVSKWSLGKQSEGLKIVSETIFTENWSDFGVANGWTVPPTPAVDPTNNVWVISSGTSRTGSNSAYISNTSGTTNDYDYTINSLNNGAYLYADITIPPNAQSLTIKFYWTCIGENSFDYGQIGFSPTSYTPTNESSTGFSTYEIGGDSSNQFDVGYNGGGTEGNWVYEEIPVSTSLWSPGDDRRLILRWRNDSNTGTQPPFAVDDITIDIQYIE